MCSTRTPAHALDKILSKFHSSAWSLVTTVLQNWERPFDLNLPDTINELVCKFSRPTYDACSGGWETWDEPNREKAIATVNKTVRWIESKCGKAWLNKLDFFRDLEFTTDDISGAFKDLVEDRKSTCWKNGQTDMDSEDAQFFAVIACLMFLHSQEEQLYRRVIFVGGTPSWCSRNECIYLIVDAFQKLFLEDSQFVPSGIVLNRMTRFCDDKYHWEESTRKTLEETYFRHRGYRAKALDKIDYRCFDFEIRTFTKLVDILFKFLSHVADQATKHCVEQRVYCVEFPLYGLSDVSTGKDNIWEQFRDEEFGFGISNVDFNQVNELCDGDRKSKISLIVLVEEGVRCCNGIVRGFLSHKYENRSVLTNLVEIKQKTWQTGVCFGADVSKCGVVRVYLTFGAVWRITSFDDLKKVLLKFVGLDDHCRKNIVDQAADRAMAESGGFVFVDRDWQEVVERVARASA